MLNNLIAYCSAAPALHPVSQPAAAIMSAGRPHCLHVCSLQAALAAADPGLQELRGLEVAPGGIPDSFGAFFALCRLSLHGSIPSFAPSQLPATLVDLTLHDGAALPQPLRVGHLTQLTRLTLGGTAYMTLLPGKQAGGAPDASPTATSLPGSLRTLVLRDCAVPRGRPCSSSATCSARGSPASPRWSCSPTPSAFPSGSCTSTPRRERSARARRVAAARLHRPAAPRASGRPRGDM
jgi:hypothetical protein